MTDKRQVNVWLEPDLFEALRELAAREERSLSNLVGRILRAEMYDPTTGELRPRVSVGELVRRVTPTERSSK